MPVNTYMVTQMQKPCPECGWYDAYVDTKKTCAEYMQIMEGMDARIDQLKQENERLKEQLRQCKCNP